jgi:hypothetical protein
MLKMSRSQCFPFLGLAAPLPPPAGRGPGQDPLDQGNNMTENFNSTEITFR